MPHVWRTLPLVCLALGLCVPLVALAAERGRAVRKVVLIAGKKSHGPGTHEYVKDVHLLKHCLDTSPNLKGITTEVHLDGWPADPATLDDADSIVVISDGSDHGEKHHPLLHGDRLDVLAKQMRRGCGFVIMHYTTFVPCKRGGEQFLEWVGGYFDYQSGKGKRPWFSKIRTATTTVTLPTPEHPVSRGLKPYKLKEEYYYNIRFRDNDPRLKPIVVTPIPGEKEPQVVAWAVERTDGGRGFGFTGGHWHNNWRLPGYRKMMLSAIAWTAKAGVPAGGVASTLPDAKPEPKAQKPIKAVVVTGHHHPGHPWRPCTEAILDVLWQDSRFEVDVTADAEFLARPMLADYDVVVLNYCNWQRAGLSEAAKKGFVGYVSGGGALAIVHFANGAFGPGARPPSADAVWPEFCGKLCRRIWIDGKSGHDAFGTFRVEIAKTRHPITEGLTAFETTDELYYNQQGDLPIEPLATARSKQTNKDEPMAFAYAYGKGRVFQTLLGHAPKSIRNPGAAALLRRGCVWAARREQIAVALPPTPPKPPTGMQVEGRFGKALNAREAVAAVAANEAYVHPPLTVECWTRLFSKNGFNILVANEPKTSATHWEIYTYARTGGFSAYLPGYAPAEIKSGKDITDGQWHHVAMVFDDRSVRLYVDGVEVANTRVTWRGRKDRHAGRLTIGLATSGTHRIWCDGVIDEVRISNTPRKIGRLPDKPFAADAGTVGLWHLDGDPLRLRFDDASPLKRPADLELR